jgi:folate-binding protein YgfZ
MLDLLAAGRAFADLSGWRKVTVSGGDGPPWLGDLVSADISHLSAGEAARSLLLSPTGRVRAEFMVARLPDTLVLLQDPGQRSVLDLLQPYRLSSDVVLSDRTDALALFALPNRSAPPEGVRANSSAPSCLGPGVDLIAPAEDHGRVLASLTSSLDLAATEDVEAWRVVAGLPRLGVDATEDDLPQEAGLDVAVAFDKGCYLGQEAVAKVRNLGHPRRLLLRLRTDGSVARGDRVFTDGREVGEVTSAATTPRGAVALARVRWDARDGPFRTDSGTALLPATAGEGYSPV